MIFTRKEEGDDFFKDLLVISYSYKKVFVECSSYFYKFL